jgi:hypothetical protein
MTDTEQETAAAIWKAINDKVGYCASIGEFDTKRHVTISYHEISENVGCKSCVFSHESLRHFAIDYRVSEGVEI